MTALEHATAVAPAPLTPRPLGTALAAALAPWGFVVANLSYTVATWRGGSDSTGAEALLLFGAHPTLTRVASLAVMVGSLLLVPAVVGILARVGPSRLARVGGWLMIGGYVAYFAVGSSNFLQLAMAEHGGPQADFASVIDAAQADPWGLWVFLLFVLGNLVGTLLFAAGLLRGRAVPGWAAVMIMCWPPLHVTGLVVGSELFEVAGAVLQALGFAAVGLALVRPPR